MRIVLLAFLIGVSLGQLAPTVYGFSDVASTQSYHGAVQFWKQRNVIEGYTDGTFRPETPISRAEFVTMTMRARGITPATGSGRCFHDVQQQWYAPYVCHAATQGWLATDRTHFRPAEMITKAEATKVVLEVFGIALLEGRFLPCDDPLNCKSWYAPYANTAYARQLLENLPFNGTHTFRRGEMALLLFRSHIITTMQVVKYHPSQQELFLRTGGPIVATVPGGSTTSYSWQTQWTTPFVPSVAIATSRSHDEAYVRGLNGPVYRIGTTTYYTGYVAHSPEHWTPILLRFDNGRRTWYRTDYDTTSFGKSYGYGFYHVHGQLYMAFATQGGSTVARTFDQHARQGWIPTFGTNGGQSIFTTVLARINIDNGTILNATYIRGQEDNSTHTAGATIRTITAHENGFLRIEAETTGLPLTPNRLAITPLQGTLRPRPFTVVLPTTLGIPNYVEAGGQRY